MKLFVDMDSDMRLADRGEYEVYGYLILLNLFHRINVNLKLIQVTKDIMERGRDLDQVLNQYMTFVKPAFEEFCLPVSITTNIF